MTSTSPPETLLLDRRLSMDQASTSGQGSSICSSLNNDRILNFSTAMMDDYQPPIKRIKTVRDPVSHRIIEKRRRDRMNNCLGDLSNLLPSRYLNKGQGRIEKTEIIELATHHIKHLNALIGASSKQCSQQCCRQNFFMGYKECGGEVMRFLVESAGTNPQDKLCVQLRQHLNEQSEKFCPSPDDLDLPQINLEEEMKMKNIAHPPLFSDSGLSDSTILQTTILDKSQEVRLRRLFANQTKEDVNDDCASWNETNQAQFAQYQNNMCSVGEHADSGLSFTSSDDMQSNKSNKEIYKFKNNIKLRFTADEGNNQSGPNGQSEFSISNSPPSSPSLESTAYPSSDYSSSNTGNSSTTSVSGSATSDNRFKNSKTDTNKLKRFDSFTSSSEADMSVPAFALHPTATHYIPIAIPSSMLCSFVDGRLLNSSNLFHPISIPVQFSSNTTSTSLKNINVAF